MSKQAVYSHFETGRAEKLEQVRTLASQDVAPDKIVAKGRELGLDSQQIARMYRLGRGELAQKEVRG